MFSIKFKIISSNFAKKYVKNPLRPADMSRNDCFHSKKTLVFLGLNSESSVTSVLLTFFKQDLLIPAAVSCFTAHALHDLVLFVACFSYITKRGRLLLYNLNYNNLSSIFWSYSLTLLRLSKWIDTALFPAYLNWKEDRKRLNANKGEIISDTNTQFLFFFVILRENPA